MTFPTEDLLVEALEALDRVGCQGQFCNGPTLEPEDMVTCYRCATVARVRVGLGQPARRPYELTWEEEHDLREARYMAKATGRPYADLLADRGLDIDDLRKRGIA